MARGGLEGTRPVGPRVLRVFKSFNGLGHNLYLSNALATLPVGRTNAVATRIATTNHEHFLTLGCHALIFAELHTSQHAVLLR